jgi:hypothetical protein
VLLLALLGLEAVDAARVNLTDGKLAKLGHEVVLDREPRGVLLGL